MNIRIKALVYMIGLLGAGVAGACLVHVLGLFVGPENMLNIFIGAILAFLLYQVYGVILARLEQDQTLKDMMSKKD